HHVPRGAVLAKLAVHPGADAQLLRVGDLVGGGDPRPERPEAVAALRPQPLRLGALAVAGRDVVHDRVAEDVVQRAGRRHGARELGEEEGLGGERRAGLRRVVAVVEADADQDPGAQRRQEARVGQRDRGGVRGGPHRRAGAHEGQQVALRQRAHEALLDEPGPRPVGVEVGAEAHGGYPRSPTSGSPRSACPRLPRKDRPPITTRLEKLRLPSRRKQYTQTGRDLVRPVVRALMRAGVTPDALTLAGLAGAAATAGLVISRHWLIAGLVFVAASLMDML